MCPPGNINKTISIFGTQSSRKRNLTIVDAAKNMKNREIFGALLNDEPVYEQGNFAVIDSGKLGKRYTIAHNYKGCWDKSLMTTDNDNLEIAKITVDALASHVDETPQLINEFIKS